MELGRECGWGRLVISPMLESSRQWTLLPSHSVQCRSLFQSRVGGPGSLAPIGVRQVWRFGIGPHFTTAHKMKRQKG